MCVVAIRIRGLEERGQEDSAGPLLQSHEAKLVSELDEVGGDLLQWSLEYLKGQPHCLSGQAVPVLDPCWCKGILSCVKQEFPLLQLIAIDS